MDQSLAMTLKLVMIYKPSHVSIT